MFGFLQVTQSAYSVINAKANDAAAYQAAKQRQAYVEALREHMTIDTQSTVPLVKKKGGDL